MILGLYFSSKFNCGSYTVCPAKIAFKKMGHFIHSIKFLPPDAAVCLYKAIIWLCTEYRLRIRGIDNSSCLEILDEQQKQVCRTAGLSLPWFSNVTSWILLYSYYFGRCSFEQVELNPDPHFSGRSTRYSKILHNYSFIIPRYYNDLSFNSCFLCTTKLWNSLSAECSSLTYDLNGLNFRAKRKKFFLGYFRNSFHRAVLNFDYSSLCNSMLFSEYPSLHWVNPSNFNVFIHTTLEVQLKVATKVFLNVQENVAWIKRLKFDQQILFLKTWDFFFSIISISKEKGTEKEFPLKAIWGFYNRNTASWTFHTQVLKLIKNDFLYSVWCMWGVVWQLPEKVHVALIRELKSSRGKLFSNILSHCKHYMVLTCSLTTWSLLQFIF